jgi:RND family efflux transporter MFP subunit
MPFDGRIAEESVDIGQYLTPGPVIATVYSTEAVEIVVPLEDRELAWFDVPTGHVNDNGKKNKGSDVKVVADFAGKKHTWQGRLARMEGAIDPRSRMVNVVVEVKDPFKVKGDRVPLVPGMFVEIVISGRKLENAIRVPRYAIRNGNQVWTANSETLHIKEVQIARSDNEYAYVISGLADGATVITSSLDTVTDGMKIRIQRTGESKND